MPGKKNEERLAAGHGTRSMRFCRSLTALLVLLSGTVWAAGTARAQQSGQARVFEEAIEDNSFLIEEAFNQEDRVVQHITNLSYWRDAGDLQASFTQEWPAWSRTHQFSYTVPLLSPGAGPGGIGDILINYRYQLGGEEEWAWVAPRVSVILPTGSTAKGLGYGSPGLQFNIPLSKRLGDGFITHLNTGLTWLTAAEGITPRNETVHRSLMSYWAGMSGIFLAAQELNLMLELLYSNDAGLESGEVVRESGLIVSPGLRFAIDLGNLQIVPGFAFPVRMGSFTPETALFGYLSFEHPF